MPTLINVSYTTVVCSINKGTEVKTANDTKIKKRVSMGVQVVVTPSCFSYSIAEDGTSSSQNVLEYVVVN